MNRQYAMKYPPHLILTKNEAVNDQLRKKAAQSLPREHNSFASEINSITNAFLDKRGML